MENKQTANKTCSVCGDTKNITYFHRCSKKSNRVQSHCKQCDKLRHEAWRARNPDKVNGYSRNWALLNQEKRKAVCAKYQKTHAAKLRDYTQRWKAAHPDYKAPSQLDPQKQRAYRMTSKAKSRSTPKGRLTAAVSLAVRRSMVKGAKAGDRWVRIVGYTLPELMVHLEGQFTPEMSWSNYGVYWQIDHILPIASFDFSTSEDQAFKDCWALSNLQPLEALENKKKGAKLFIPLHLE